MGITYTKFFISDLNEGCKKTNDKKHTQKNIKVDQVVPEQYRTNTVTRYIYILDNCVHLYTLVCKEKDRRFSQLHPHLWSMLQLKGLTYSLLCCKNVMKILNLNNSKE